MTRWAASGRSRILDPTARSAGARRWSLAALVLGIWLSASVGSPAAAATPQRVLSGDFHRGLALALDSSGHRHVVATSGSGDLWYATDRSGTWHSQRILVGERGAYVWSQPAIAADQHGRVHIVAVREYAWDTPGSTGGIFYRTDKGRPRGQFAPKVRIAPPRSDDPSLRVADGVLYLAYQVEETGPEPSGDEPIMFMTTRRGRWHVEKVADNGFLPSLRVDANGRARIVYTDLEGLRYSEARTRIGDFTAPARIPGTLGRPGTPSLALDRAGRPHVAWTSWAMDPAVLFIERSADGWTPRRGLGQGHSAELSIDALGRPHVVAGGQRVVHRWLVGGEWRSHVLEEDVDVAGVDIRAFGYRVTVAWCQEVRPRGVWVVRD